VIEQWLQVGAIDDLHARSMPRTVLVAQVTARLPRVDQELDEPPTFPIVC
jgi:hypothetical protein